MKTIIILAALAVALAVPIGNPNTFSTPSTGWAFSGAGGRIAQQAALAQTLLNGTSPNGQKIIPSHLAGASSGALSVIGLNGVLEYQYSGGARGWSFGAWNNFLFNLRDSSVFKTGVRGVFSSASNLDDGYILDNSPLVDTLNSALSQIGYTNFGDLFLPSWITTVDQRTGKNLRLLSTDPLVSNIPLIQILLATTAIPVAFQPRAIPALTNNTLFIDGGTGIDYLPVIPLIDGSNVTNLYAFIPNQDTNNGNNGDNDSTENQGLIRNFLKAYEIEGNAKLVGDLAILGNSKGVTGYTYSAVLGRTFSTLNFDDEQTQYNLVAAWAKNNNPSLVSSQLVLDFDAVLPAYYKNGSDAYTYNNLGLFGSATTAGVCTMLVAAVLAALL